MWARLISVIGRMPRPLLLLAQEVVDVQLGHLGHARQLALAQPLQQDLVAQVVAELGHVQAVGHQPAPQFRPRRCCSARDVLLGLVDHRIVGRTPFSRASCSCAFSVISRSSTSRASCAAAAWASPAAPAAARSGACAPALRCW
jgi:hypothetical protein